jgi:hypothetical protein
MQLEWYAVGTRSGCDGCVDPRLGTLHWKLGRDPSPSQTSTGRWAGTRFRVRPPLDSRLSESTSHEPGTSRWISAGHVTGPRHGGRLTSELTPPTRIIRQRPERRTEWDVPVDGVTSPGASRHGGRLPCCMAEPAQSCCMACGYFVPACQVWLHGFKLRHCFKLRPTRIFLPFCVTFLFCFQRSLILVLQRVILVLS